MVLVVLVDFIELFSELNCEKCMSKSPHIKWFLGKESNRNSFDVKR